MARGTSRSARRVRPELAITAVVVGSVTAAIGVNAAVAAPSYPSWDDIQNAKKDEAATAAKVDELSGLLAGLQATADQAARTQQIASEKYLQAKSDADDAAEREDELTAKAAEADERAKVSKMRAGLLAAHLARTGGGDLSMGLALSGDQSSDLLKQLGTMTQLSQGSKKIYDDALSDQKLASNLGAQAAVASTRRTALAAEAATALTAASDASDRAAAAVREQEARQGELIAQLATLKNTTAAAEAAYQQGLAAQRAAAGGSGSGSGGSSSGGSSSGGGNSGGGGSSGGGNSGGGQSSQPVQPQPAPQPGPVGDPVTSKVETAIAFARAQIGEPYQFAGEGPDRWDCSGLTLKAYAAAGISIGTHSATNQFNTARNRGQLVPYSQAQPGDLIFWTSGDGDMYHVAIYTGGGMMIEAPSEGYNVRERSVWGAGDRYPYVARPTA